MKNLCYIILKNFLLTIELIVLAFLGLLIGSIEVFIVCVVSAFLVFVVQLTTYKKDREKEKNHSFNDFRKWTNSKRK